MSGHWRSSDQGSQVTREITYIAPKIKQLIARRGIQLALGQRVTPTKLEPIIQEMVKLLEESVGLRPPGDFYDIIVTNKGLKLDRPFRAFPSPEGWPTTFTKKRRTMCSSLETSGFCWESDC